MQRLKQDVKHFHSPSQQVLHRKVPLTVFQCEAWFWIRYKGWSSWFQMFPITSKTNVSQENTAYDSFNVRVGSGPDAKAGMFPFISTRNVSQENTTYYNSNVRVTSGPDAKVLSMALSLYLGVGSGLAEAWLCFCNVWPLVRLETPKCFKTLCPNHSHLAMPGWVDQYWSRKGLAGCRPWGSSKMILGGLNLINHGDDLVGIQFWVSFFNC